MATLPTTYPKLPFLAKIPGGMREKTMIRINGNIGHKTGGIGRFKINFLCEPVTHPLGDVPFHMDVGVKDGIIIHNIHTYKLGWGFAKKSDNCPISNGEEYEILILGQENNYKIVINGTVFCTFSHRLIMSNVRYIYVLGDTIISSLRVEHDVDPEYVGIPKNRSFSSDQTSPYEYSPRQFFPNQSIASNIRKGSIFPKFNNIEAAGNVYNLHGNKDLKTNTDSFDDSD